MCAAPFELFLIRELLTWLDGRVIAGQRYQFRSPDPSNTRALFEQYNVESQGSLEVYGTDIPYMEINDIRLLCVAQSDSTEMTSGHNEHFISMLRDQVSSQEGPFDKSALLVIHNSLLDTLVSSAADLSEPGSAWSPKDVKLRLSDLASAHGNTSSVYNCLLDWQEELMVEDGSSVFEFRQMHGAIVKEGVLDLTELGLFRDSALVDMAKPDQIGRRLDENRRLHEQCEKVVELFPNEIAERLNLSDRFVKSHFTNDAEVPWKEIDYQVLRNEIAQQEGSKLEFAKLQSESCEIIGPRDQSSSSAGRRKKNIILAVKENNTAIDLLIEFIGDELHESNIVVDGDQQLKTSCDIEVRRSRSRRRISFRAPFSGKPTFFRIRLRRSLTSERFEFYALAIPHGCFYTPGFQNTFTIDVAKQTVELHTEELELLVNPEVAARWQLAEGAAVVNSEEYGLVDYAEAYEESDIVTFKVTSPEHDLTFKVEGEASQEVLSLPLLLDRSRFNKLFDDEYNGKYLKDKQRVVIDNKEAKVVSLRSKLLDVEEQMVSDRLLCYSDSGNSRLALSIREDAPELYSAWKALVDYLDAKKTLPSLCSWGSDFIDLSTAYVSAYLTYLQSIKIGHSLSDSVRTVLRIGMARVDGRDFLTPFHPLNLAYYAQLAKEITLDDENRSFADVPPVTRQRLSARGLLPYVYSVEHDYCCTQNVEENQFWLEIVPQARSSYDYIRKLTCEKIEEFVKTFDELFKDGTDAPLLINSVNNGENYEVFVGILDYFRNSGRESEKIHVNLYDAELTETEFDQFAELRTYQEIRSRYGLDMGKQKESADRIIDLLRSRLTFSKFRIEYGNEQAYAHVTFFRNNEKVECVGINIKNHISGVACDGLLSGEASCREHGNYFTGFGLRSVDTSDQPHLVLAQLLGTLQKPLAVPSETYHDSSAIRLAVSDKFRDLLQQSCESSLWVTIIDPKVTLNFFEETKDVVLIHFSDQYTKSAGYDAITITRQTDLYRDVLRGGSDAAIGEFNAFNGEWLLKMVTVGAKTKKEREGIVGTWKVVSCLLAKSGITWVPLSVAEMIRVSGNIGLKMSDSDFSRYHKGKKFTGRISDDILFAGFRDGRLYLLPVEVKTGSGDLRKAHDQVKALREYLVDGLFGSRTLESKLYRGLFFRQILMQIEKYQLYSVFQEGYFEELLADREEWLRGEYYIEDLPDYPSGLVVAHLDSESCFETRCSQEDGIARIEFPSSFLDTFLSTPRDRLEERILSENFPGIADWLFLRMSGGEDSTEVEPSAQSEANVEPSGDQGELRAVDVENTEETAITTTSDVLKVEFGRNTVTDNTVFWEPTNTERVLNPNLAIIGTMGTGKTQFTKSVITQMMRNQNQNVDGLPVGVLIFDYKADYVKPDFVEATGARVLDLHRLPFNPFALFGDRPMLPVHTASQFRATITKAFGLGNKQQNRINTLVIDAYERAGIIRNDPDTWNLPAPTLQDVWELYNEQEKLEEDSLHAALNELVTFEIFEPESEATKSLYDLIDGVTVIKLSGYDPIIQNLVVALALDIFYAQMHQKGSSIIQGALRQLTKLVLVDEADNFMKQEFPGLRKLLKEGREFGVGTVLSTQELTHFKPSSSNDYSGYIQSWVVHRISSIKSQDIKDMFNVATKDDVDRLSSGIKELEKHHSLYIDGEKRVQKIEDLPFWRLVE